MKVVLFRIRVRVDVDQAEYQRTFEQMLKLVSTVPGFRGIEGFAGEDGSELAIAWFDSDEALAEWRQHPEHVATQERGRTEFFSAYDITVADVVRHYKWPDTETNRSEEQATGLSR